MLYDNAKVIADEIIIYDNVWPEAYDYFNEKNIDKNLSWINSTVKANTVPEINYDYRKVYISLIPYLIDDKNNDFNKMHNGKLIKEISDLIRINLDPFLDNYIDQLGLVISHKERYNILKYEKGDFFLEHEDDDGSKKRAVSLIYYINDDYEGGEIYFRLQGLKIKPKAGQLLVFPSNGQFRHSISEVTEGTRYCIVSWAS